MTEKKASRERPAAPAADGVGAMKRLTLRIDFGGDCQLGPGKVRLLEQVDRSGSITAAAKLMDMSYRRAWLLVDELNHMFEAPLVDTRLGGRGGPNARLTVLGRAVVQIYRSIEKDAHDVSAARVDELHRRLNTERAPGAKGNARGAGEKREA